MPGENEKLGAELQATAIAKTGQEDGGAAVGGIAAATAEKPGSSSGSSLPEKDLKKVDTAVIEADKVEDPFAHLPEEQRVILKRQLDIPEGNKNGSLYRFATRNDLIIAGISALCAIGAGATMPLMTVSVLMGGLAETFKRLALNTIDGDEFSRELVKYTLYFVYLGIGMFVLTYAHFVGFIYTGEHIAQKIREKYLHAILRQNIAVFDKLGAGEITTRITSDTNLCQDAISQKVGLTLQSVSTFISAFVIGFIRSWKLTLIMSSTVFSISIGMTIGASVMIKETNNSLQAYAQGGSLAEEVVSSIRNAVAFATQEKLARDYNVHLNQAKKHGVRMRVALGFMLGWMMFSMYGAYALGFFQGTRQVARRESELSDVLTTLLAIIIGAFSLGHVGPNVQAFTSGAAAAKKIYAMIDRESPLDPTSDKGEKIEDLKGDIEFKNVSHIYPSRPEVQVLTDFNLVIPAGKITALVGASGSGKSTIVGLIERFYEPVAGEIFLDGINIEKLNIKWIRQNVSLVSQEPVLFATTIFENIAYGLIGTKHENDTDEEKRTLVEKAAQMANADTFIRNLPEGYETHVGERGFLLSGGQKQRIAIARAIVSDPKILLLDEATSALDTTSEGIVQRALDKASQGRTTISIAHRLSTIKNADNIVVMQEGRLVEQGTHDELLERKGAYYSLVEAQKIDAQPSTDTNFEDSDLPLKLARTVSEKNEVPAEDEKIGLTRTQTAKSKSSVALEGRTPEGKKQYPLFTLIKFIASFTKKETWASILGMCTDIIGGLGYPTQAFLFAKSISNLSLPESQYDKMEEDSKFWSLMYLVLALTQLFAYVSGAYPYAYTTELLIKRARYGSFRHILRQEIGFFDREENSAGILTSYLSTETTHLASISGSTLSTILNAVTTLIGSFVVALAFGWKLALVCIATVPFVLSSGFLHFWMLERFEGRAKKAYEGSASYACEATAAIRTVASLTREKDVERHYHERLKKQIRASVRSVSKSSLAYSGSQASMFLCIALGFWYGGQLIKSGEYDTFKFFVAFSAIIFGSQSAATVFSFSGDMGKAKQAANSMKNLFDRKPEIDTWSNEGEPVPSMEGSVEFRDVHFRYPTRPEQRVLRGLNITIKPGQYVALCGASGCGKSTTIQLLERFYNPLAGGIYVDGKEISTLNLNEYRSYLALVSQEPTLYQGTIRENILLGADRDDISEEQIIQACKDANIYDFIMSLPEGFNTTCGSKGTLLSGGQKQRIAIARALIRNPRILLLDEATSALDSTSEKVVQAALDVASKGRTTIAVAHRLSTIQKADVIYVLDQGVVCESGTHAELMRMKGKYYDLVNLQSLEKTS